MISLVLAAAMQTSPVVLSQSEPSAPPARYVRLRMQVNGYGIAGSGELLVDRQSGRYFEHVNLGPQSFYQGYDGTRAWLADVKGTVAVQGNAVDRGTLLAWGYLFSFPRTANVRGPMVRFAGVPQAVSFTLDAATKRVQRISLSNGLAEEVVKFFGYRAFSDGITAPAGIVFTDDNGTWAARVTGVQTVTDALPSDFAPPARANDSSISGGTTSVHFPSATEILIPVRINNGPVMHFILDTGGQNVLFGSSVKRLGLHTVGHGTVGGAGAGVVPTSFVTVRSVRVGTAQMRNQAFLVLDIPFLKGIDGIVGFELLSRFAARIDYTTNTVTLAAAAPASWTKNVAATPFTFRSHQPQVDGAIDAFPGALTIDTGNSGVLDINSPFAARHDLWTYYHADTAKNHDLVGVGGKVKSADVTVRRLRIGSALLENVHGDLTHATSGIEAHPGFAANVGQGVFRNFSFVLDYPHDVLYFAPGGIRDMSGVLFERNGERIVVRQLRTHLAMRAGVRVGMTLTDVNGKPVTARDLAAVEAALQGKPGSKVDLVFDGRKRVRLMLLNYL